MGKKLNIAGALVIGAAMTGIGGGIVHELKSVDKDRKPVPANVVKDGDNRDSDDAINTVVKATREAAPRAVSPVEEDPAEKIRREFLDLKEKSLNGDLHAQEALWNFLIMGSERKTAEDVGMDSGEYVQFIGKLAPAKQINKALHEGNFEEFLRAISSLEKKEVDDQFLKMIGFTSKDALIGFVKNIPGINTQELSASAYLALRKLDVEHNEAFRLTKVTQQ